MTESSPPSDTGWFASLRKLFPFKRNPKRRDLYGQGSFQRLVQKFANIRYLVEQKATVDVIEKTPVAICITNEQHIYEYVNPAYCKLYGYEFDELIGKAFTIVVPEEFQVELTSLHDQFMNREYELEGQWEVVRKDGKRLKILANAAYIVDEQGRPKKVTFVLDMTEKLGALARLEQVKSNATIIHNELLTVAQMAEDASSEAIAKRLRDILKKTADLIGP